LLGEVRLGILYRTNALSQRPNETWQSVWAKKHQHRKKQHYYFSGADEQNGHF
jgi:hypothetical protein